MAKDKSPAVRSGQALQRPFFHSLQHEIDRVFDRFMDNGPFSASELLERTGRRVWPAIDVADTETAVEISAEIPGVKEDDLDVSITDGSLVLKGEKSSDHEEKEKDYMLVERTYGSFRRTVPLGFTPEDGKVEAKFANGVLKVRVEKPKEAASKTQRIAVKAS